MSSAKNTLFYCLQNTSIYLWRMLGKRKVCKYVEREEHTCCLASSKLTRDQHVRPGTLDGNTKLCRILTYIKSNAKQCSANFQGSVSQDDFKCACLVEACT